MSDEEVVAELQAMLQRQEDKRNAHEVEAERAGSCDRIGTEGGNPMSGLGGEVEHGD